MFEASLGLKKEKEKKEEEGGEERRYGLKWSVILKSQFQWQTTEPQINELATSGNMGSGSDKGTVPWSPTHTNWLSCLGIGLKFLKTQLQMPKSCYSSNYQHLAVRTD